MKVGVQKTDEGYALNVKGSVNVLMWIPFKMRANLHVDTETNTLVIDPDKVSILGGIPATGLLRWKPLRFESLLSLPPNDYLMVRGNKIMVKPFGLFPPPRITGRVASVSLDGNWIRLRFSGEAIQAPESAAKNYIYMKGGISEFGRFRMFDTNVLILDQDETDRFVFSLKHYAEMIPKSNVEVRDTQSVRVTMPDFPGE
jgi:hypothetical protein